MQVNSEQCLNHGKGCLFLGIATYRISQRIPCVLYMTLIEPPFRVPTSLDSRSSSSLKRSRIPMNLLLLHTQALLLFTTSLRVTRGARDLHVVAEEVAWTFVLCGCPLLMLREYLWCEILGSVEKRSRFASEYFTNWGGHVRTRRCGFATPLINFGEEGGTTVLTLTLVWGVLSEKEIFY